VVAEVDLMQIHPLQAQVDLAVAVQVQYWQQEVQQ
jgi:hypothetical protein